MVESLLTSHGGLKPTSKCPLKSWRAFFSPKLRKLVPEKWLS
jgi:hypothetical protein